MKGKIAFWSLEPYVSDSNSDSIDIDFDSTFDSSDINYDSNSKSRVSYQLFLILA